MTETPLYIVVTGATGFVGAAQIEMLRDRGHRVDGWSQRRADFAFRLEDCRVPEVVARWCKQLHGVDVVVHAAARVHQLTDTDADAALYRLVNAEAPLMLARAAQRAGVKRFVFLSTAKIYGEGCAVAYREASTPAPEGAYAQSKYCAEQGLRELAATTAMEITILRPPLVYGLGVGGNFQQLWRLANSPWPLPLAALNNRRAMIALDNLLEIAALCCEDKRAANQTFNVADALPYTLGDIVGAQRQALGHRKKLWRFPPALLRILIRWWRGPDDVQRLLGDFQLDIAAVRATLGWAPRWDMVDISAQMVARQTTAQPMVGRAAP